VLRSLYFDYDLCQPLLIKAQSTKFKARLQKRRFRSLCTFSMTARSSCTSMKRYLRHSALASA